MRIRNKNLYLLSLGIIMLISGCLTVERKEYHFKINPDGSGTGTIKFVNIVSVEDEETDVSIQDFQALIDDYLNGNVFEEQNPGYQIVEKRLYEQDGILIGEIEFTFPNIEAAGFFRDNDCKCASYYYYLGSSLSETLIHTDGENLFEKYEIPVIRWQSDNKEFNLVTMVQEDMENAHNLVELYREWKKE